MSKSAEDMSIELLRVILANGNNVRKTALELSALLVAWRDEAVDKAYYGAARQNPAPEPEEASVAEAELSRYKKYYADSCAERDTLVDRIEWLQSQTPAPEGGDVVAMTLESPTNRALLAKEDV